MKKGGKRLSDGGSLRLGSEFDPLCLLLCAFFCLVGFVVGTSSLFTNSNFFSALSGSSSLRFVSAFATLATLLFHFPCRPLGRLGPFPLSSSLASAVPSSLPCLFRAVTVTSCLPDLLFFSQLICPLWQNMIVSLSVSSSFV